MRGTLEKIKFYDPYLFLKAFIKKTNQFLLTIGVELPKRKKLGKKWFYLPIFYY